MRKHLFLMLSMAAMLLLPMFSNAQTVYFTDGFEDGFAEGWTQEFYDAASGQWVTETPTISQPWKTESAAEGTLEYPKGAAVGSGRAYFRQEAAAGKNVQTTGYRTRLITPKMNLSGYQPILRFYHAQAKWTADFDTLRVYYRQGQGTQWELLREYTSYIQKWKFEEMDLPRTGDDYQLAFEANENMGHGIVLDSVIIRTKPQITTPHDMAFYDMRDNGVNLTWEASKDADAFRVIVAEMDLDLNVNPMNIDSVQYIVLDTLISSEFAQDIRLENLASGRVYYMQVQSIGEFENSVWSETFSFRMKPVVNITPEKGYYESFYLPYKSNSMKDQQLETWTWGGDWEPVIPLWVGQEYFNVYSPDGSEAVAFVGQKTSSSGVITYSIGKGQTSYIASPEISGKGIENFSMSMCHVTFWGTTYTYQHNRAKAIIVGIMTDPEDLTTFVPVDTCEVWGYKQFTFFDVDLSSYTGNGRYVAFVSNFQDNENWFALDDVTIELKPAIGAVVARDIKVIPDTTSAVLSWPAVAGATAYKVKYLALENKGKKVPLFEKNMTGAVTVQSSTNSIILADLAVRKKYAFCVQAIGVDNFGIWSQPREFYTSASITVPKKYEFEETEGTYSREGEAASELFARDWTVFTNDADAPYLYTSYYRSGTRCLYLTKDQYNEAWTVAPMMEDMKQVEIVLYARLSSTSYLGSNVIVGVMEDPSDLKTFTPIATFKPSNTGYERFSTNFSKYDGNGKYIALVWGESGTSKNALCIDDVTIRPLANCQTPFVSIEQLTDTSALLKWEKLDEIYRYNVKVSKKALNDATILTATGKDLILELVDSSDDSLLLKDLKYSTNYYVYVQTICSETEKSDWVPVSFQTPCPEKMKLPYKTSFENEATSTIPDCWIKPTWTTTTSTYPYVNSSYHHGDEGAQCLYMYSTTNYGSTIALPEFDVALDKVKISFWAYYSSSDYKVMVGLMNDPNNPMDFYPTDTFYTVASTWIRCEAMFNASDLKFGKYIAISSYTGSTNYVYIDDVEVVDIVDAAPFNYKKVDGGSDWLEIGWDGITTAKWDVIISKSCYAMPDSLADKVNPGDSIPAEDILVNTQTATNSYKIESGLNALTWYYVYGKSTVGTRWSLDSIQTECTTWNPRVKMVQGFETDADGNDIRTVTYSLSSTTTYVSYFKNALVPECWTVGNAKWGTDLSQATSYTYRNYFPYICTDGTGTSAKPTAYAEKAGTSYQYSSDGVNSLKVYSSYSSTASSNYAPAWAAMNKLECSDEDLKMLILTFDYAMATSTAANQPAIVIGIMDDPTDLSTFTVLDSIPAKDASGTGSHKHKSVEIALENYEGTGRYIAFRGGYGATSTFYLDNVSVSLASCPAPSPSVSQITDTTVVLASGLRVDNGWQYIVTDTMYQPSLLDDGQMPDPAHIVLQASVTDPDGDAAPKMTRIKGLQDNTDYCIYVSTLCDGNESSAWRMVSFTTLCKDVDIDTWVGNFENDTTVSGFKPECWTVGSLTPGAADTYIPYVLLTTRKEIMQDSAAAKLEIDEELIGAKVLSLYAYSTTSVGAYAATPGLKVPAGKKLQDYQVMFKGFGTTGQNATTTSSSYAHNLRVGVMDDPSDLSTLVVLDTISLPTNTQQCEVSLSSYKGKGKFVAFLLEKETPTYSRAYIYDVHFGPIQPCKAPRRLKADSISANTLVISWQGSSASYKAAVSKKQYTEAEKAAGYLLNDSVKAADGVVLVDVTTTEATFTGLTPATEYYVYVSGSCEGEADKWSYESLQIITDCSALSSPYYENFEKYATGAYEHQLGCWQMADYAGTGYPKVLKPTSGAVDGNQLELWSTSTTHRCVAIMPTMQGNLSDYVLKFDARSYGTTTASVLYVGTMKDINDMATFAAFDTVYMEGGNEFTHREYTLANYALKYNNIAFSSGLAATLEMNSDMYMDNVFLGLPGDTIPVEPEATCFAPTNLQVDNVVYESAVVSFVPADSLSSKWEIVLTNSNTKAAQTQIVDTTFFEFNDLKPNTTYSVKVRTICDDENSDYSASVSFSTLWKIDTYKWSFNQNEQGTVSLPNKPGVAVATYALHPALTPSGSDTILNYSSNTTYLPYQIANTATLAYSEDKRAFVADGDTARSLRLYRTNTYDYSAVILPYIINPAGKQLSMDVRFGYAYASCHTTDTLRNTVSTVYSSGILCIGTVDSLSKNLHSYKEIARVYPSPMFAKDLLRKSNKYGWMHYVLPLDMDLKGKQLVFALTGAGNQAVYIDNLAIEAEEGHTTPIITTVVPGDTYATIKWTGTAEKYNIYVVDTTKAPGVYKKGFFPYLQDAPDSCITKISDVTGNSYKVTGLESGGQTYEFYVEDAINNTKPGALSNRKFAKTVCEAIQVDGTYEYGFEPGPKFKRGADPSKSTADGFTFQWPTSTTASDTVYKTPECWTIGITYESYDPTSTTYKSYNPTLRSNSMTAAAASQYRYARNGYSCMQFYGTSTYKEVYAVMPLLTGFDTDTMEINFWGRCTYEKIQTSTVYTTSYLKGTSYSTKMAVGTMTDPNDAATFVALDTIEYDFTQNDMSTSTEISADKNMFWLNFTVPMKGAVGPYIAFKQVGYGYFYMDDLKIQKRQTARRPRGLEVSDITSTSATLSWTPMEEGGSYVVEVSESATNWETPRTYNTENTSFKLTGLVVAKEYFFRVKQVGSVYGDTEYAHYVSFRTECESLSPNGYKTGFENDDESDPWQVIPGATGTNVNTMKQNQCWTYWNMGTTQTVSSTYFPYNIVNTASAGYSHSGNYALKLNQYTTSAGATTYRHCVVSPFIDAEIGEAGKGFDTLQISFWACPTYHGLSGTNNGKISSASGTSYAKYIEIGTCTDPADLSTYTVLQGWTYEVEGDNLKTGVQADANNDYAFRKVTVKLNAATGNYVFIRPNVNRGDGKTGFTYSTMYIDDLQFEKLKACETPSNLNAPVVTTRNATIAWDSEALMYDVQVSEDPTFTDEAKTIVDTTGLDTTELSFEGLKPSKQYYYRVMAFCDAERKDASDWTPAANFRTPFAPLYNEQFTTTSYTAEGWRMCYGYADKVFAGKAAPRDTTSSSTYNSWYRVQNLAISGYALRSLLGYAASANPSYPISSTYQAETYLQKYWMISPSITIEKENAQLAFDACLTNYTTADPITVHDHWNEGWDDQFMVIVSEDDGATWKKENAIIWNNETSNDPSDEHYKYGIGDYVLTSIPATPTQMSIDLNKYVGKTIRIAFYAENTVQNAMNAIHIDAVHVNYLTKKEESMSLCQFEDIEGVLGFSINGDTVSAGEMKLERSFLSPKDGENDSLFILNVEYKEAPQYYYEITICAGTPFEYMGFNQHTAPGTYRMKLTSVVTDCDSIVNFTIRHAEALRTQIDTTICSNQYIEFGGKLINEAGTYYDTLQACPFYGGCDSIVTLNLGIRQADNMSIPVSILHGEYYELNGKQLSVEGAYLDTLMNAAGCDSIVGVVLTVNYAAPIMTSDSICQGETYTWRDKIYSSAGVYYDTVVVGGGQADQIYGLTLKINQPSPETKLQASIWHGEIYNLNGQMLTESGVYVDSLKNKFGCDSVIILTLDVKPVVPVIESDSICQGETYTWRGKEYNQADTYYDTVLVSGQADQIFGLKLKINQPSPVTNIQAAILHGETYQWFDEILTESAVKDTTLVNVLGCDSVVILNLTVRYADVVYEDLAICKGDTLEWYGKTYTEIGTYLDTIRVEGQADKLVGLVLTVKQPSSTFIAVDILHGETYQWFDQVLTESGKYVETLANQYGCDSIVTLNLAVSYAATIDTVAAICEGETLAWLGKEYSKSGMYYDTVRAEGVADQPWRLILTVNKPSYSNVSAAILHGETYQWFDETLTKAGTYIETLANQYGCDSIITLNLAVSYAATIDTVAAICDGDVFTWNGKEYSTAGIYYDTVRVAGVADQPWRLILTVNKPSASEFAAAICEGDFYQFGDRKLYESGSYIDTLVNQYGCDSIVTLRLTVYQPENQTLDVTICHGTTYLFNGVELDKSGTYVDTIIDSHKCDAVITLNLTVSEPLTGTHRAQFCGASYTYQGVDYDEGTYEVWIKNEKGCDSIVTLILTRTYDVYDTLNVTLCAGETYSDEHFTVNKPGIYNYEEAQAGGCTYYYILNYSNYATDSTMEVTITTDELPYQYMTLYYGPSTEPGVYTDTIETTSIYGCELLVYHILNVKSTEGIDNIFSDDSKQTMKVIYDDHMYIIRRDGWYNASGQKVCDPRK